MLNPSLASFSVWRFCKTSPTSDSRGAMSWLGLGGRMQNGDTSECNCSSKASLCSSFCWSSFPFSWSSSSFSSSFVPFSRSSLSFSRSSFSFLFTSCFKLSTFLKTSFNFSVGKFVWFWTSLIFHVGRLSASNAVLTFIITLWKFPSERWPRGICANFSFRNFLKSSTFNLMDGLRECMQSEYRIA